MCLVPLGPMLRGIAIEFLIAATKHRCQNVTHDQHRAQTKQGVKKVFHTLSIHQALLKGESPCGITTKSGPVGSPIAIHDAPRKSGSSSRSLLCLPAKETLGDRRENLDALVVKVLNAPISNFFLHYENKVGTDKNFEEILGDVRTWEHFHLNLPSSVIRRKDQIPSQLGAWRSTFGVFKRGLETLTNDAIDRLGRHPPYQMSHTQA